jgi:hypothetical protein
MQVGMRPRQQQPKRNRAVNEQLHLGYF